MKSFFWTVVGLTYATLCVFAFVFAIGSRSSREIGRFICNGDAR
jgi:hypothetical protein